MRAEAGWIVEGARPTVKTRPLRVERLDDGKAIEKSRLRRDDLWVDGRRGRWAEKQRKKGRKEGEKGELNDSRSEFSPPIRRVREGKNLRGWNGLLGWYLRLKGGL